MGKMEDILEKDLENAETKEAIEIVKGKADRYGLEKTIALAQAKLDRLNEQAVNAGGDSQKVDAMTAGVDEKIDEVEKAAEVEIKMVQAEKTNEQGTLSVEDELEKVNREFELNQRALKDLLAVQYWLAINDDASKRNRGSKFDYEGRVTEGRSRLVDNQFAEIDQNGIPQLKSGADTVEWSNAKQSEFDAEARALREQQTALTKKVAAGAN